MALRKKLSTYGNSKALVIEKPIIELLQWDVDRELVIEVAPGGKGLVIRQEPRKEE